MAQLIERLTTAQVMISWFVGSSPARGLCPDSSEPGPCFGFFVSLSLCPSPAHALSLSKLNKHKKIKKQKRIVLNLLQDTTK